MLSRFLLAALLCVPAGAADLSGKWVGAIEIAGQSSPQPLILILKQDGAALSGTAGPTAANQRELSNGKVEGDTISFDIPAGRNKLHAKLSLVSDRLVGDATGSDAPAIKLSATRYVRPTAETLRAQLAEIGSLVGADFAKSPIGSVTVGVVSANELIWSKSYGNADMENQTPADRDTVYRIGSITKMFTALMLEQLAEAGKLHLSDPAEKYFPEVKTIQGRYPDAPPITLVQLSTHTAGLSREPDDLATYLKGPVSDWEKVLIAALPHTHYEFEPGTRWFYSNVGFAILGATLARAAGQPYAEYVPKHIFEPLGMTHTALEPNPKMLPHLSKGYQMQGAEVDAKTAQSEHEGRGYKVPNGAIYTTVGDLGRFASFLLGEGPESVLKKANLERTLAQSPVQADFELSSGYGLGFEVSRRDKYISFGHDGAVAGYQAALYMNRKAGLAVIVLANVLGRQLNTTALAERSLDILSK